MASTIKVDTISEKTSANGVTIDSLSIKDGGLVAAGNIDVNGNNLVLDANANTYLDAGTDDTIKVYVSGAEDLRIAANAINVLSGTTLTIDSGATITNSGTANGFGALAGIDDQSSSNDDQLTISDTAVIINEDSDDLDFRVEGNGEANLFVVDGGTDTVTIGLAPGNAENVRGAIRKFQIEGLNDATSSMSLTRNSNDSYSPKLTFCKTRGTAVNSDTIAQDDDYTGEISFCCADGTDRLNQTANIYSRVDGGIGGNDTPGALVFGTTADGGTTPSAHLTITEDGRGLSQWTAKVWFNFNGTSTPAFRDSHNCSSITDGGTGFYTVNFSNNLANVNYSTVVMSGNKGQYWGIPLYDGTGNYAVGAVGFYLNDTSDSAVDNDIICGQIFGD